MENQITVQNSAEEKRYSAFQYGLGAVLAFFGISSKTHRASKKRAKLVGDIVTYIILLFGAFLMVYPFWWMLAASFANTNSSNGLIAGDVRNSFSTMIWWPKHDTFTSETYYGGAFHNYAFLFATAFDGSSDASGFPAGYNYWRAIGNNLLYSIVPVVVGVITSASAAFSFAKIEWVGRNKVFMFLLAAIMVPGPSIMTAQFVMYKYMGMGNDTGWALIVPGLFGSIMTAFFIRQFLFGLPTSIIEAAKIDGAGYFRIFCGFILPLAMPAIMAQGLLSFMGCWNNYLASYIFISPQSPWMNLPHAMTILAGVQGNNMGAVMAAAVLCILPVLILFACFQKLIIGSLMLTGSKE
ncbi:MAG: carbohydrate ABC transporter permease [Clostridia bacterium]|nr:carbohydrate ABC transporter permease [Clostridia bacterium]